MRVLPSLALLAALTVMAAAPTMAAERSFRTTDGVRLHYTDQGSGHTIVLVPGWTMPGWIFQAQIDDLSRHYRVIAFDPRGQGDSEAAPDGYEPGRRGEDIADLLHLLGPERVLLIGWSLGVLDALAYVHSHGAAALAGLVLIDNSVGEDPPPAPARHPLHGPRNLSRETRMRLFVRSMFARPRPAAWIDRLTAACLRTPETAAAALLNYPVPRSYWKDAIYAVDRPVLYVVTPRFAGQATNLRLHDPYAESVVMEGVGHALFVDEPARFDALVDGFARRRVWQ